MRVEPLQNYVVLRALPTKPKAGLVERVSLSERPSVEAEVVAIGPEVCDLAVGDRVLCSRLQGFTVELDEPYLLMRESAVLALL